MYVIIHKIAAKDWTVLNFNKINVVVTPTPAATNINAEQPANDEAILSAA